MSRQDAHTLALQAPSSKAILATAHDPKQDLLQERRKATFPVEELKLALNGGPNKLAQKERLLKLAAKYSWADKSRRHFLTREEEYVGALQAALGIWNLMKDEGLSLDDGAVLRTLLDFPGGLELHIGMFIPSIRSQGSPEQQAKWLPLCYNLDIIGTYAQTELAHGTFVRGLETTATYDKTTQEFILHSPTLTSTKWWPGGLGKTSTHAVVMARLFIDGKDYGPHGFVVQLRDMSTHHPLPGVRIGDIGPKFGYGGVDNGFMTFDHVRIPRDAMLNRFSQVTPEGQYVPPPPANSKASYATMVFVRADIVRNAGLNMARAATIAARYSAVRRQTSTAPGTLETQVLDYQNTAAVVLPAVAHAYALHYMGDSMMAMYRQFEKDRDRNDFSALPELHALSSGLKALCTWITADGIEACRRCCGGHGFSKLSGLPSLYQNYVQNVTWEGDNAVLCLQTARYLLKTLSAVWAGQGAAAQASAAYLKDVPKPGGSTASQGRCSVQAPGGWQDHAAQSAALRHVAGRLVARAHATLTAATAQAAAAAGKPVPKGGLSFEGPAWNTSTLALIKAAKAHCFLVLHANLVEYSEQEASSGRVGPSTQRVLGRLASLLALHHMAQDLGDFLEDGYMSGSQAQALRQEYSTLLTELRPDAVALVDAFAIDDYLLNSCLGRSDGDVYAALLEAAQASPLNATEEGPAWRGVLQPLLDPTMKQQGTSGAARPRL